jgi:hypothetical protein
VLSHAQSFFACELEQGKGAMQTRSTRSDLTTVGIELAELRKRGIRRVLPEFVDDLPPVRSNPRWMATAMGLRGTTTRPAKPREQLSHKTRAHGKTLGQLTD